MRKYIKPSLEVKSFKVSEDIAALKEYYYMANDSKRVALFQLTKSAVANA